MKEFLESFSNREIAIILWLVVAVISAVIVAFKEVFSVVKMLFSKAFLPFYLIFAIYFTSIIYWLNSSNIWEVSLYKDFIFWFFTTATVSFFKANDVNSWRQLNSLVLHVFSWNIIVEFLIDTYNFNLVFEIIFIAIMAFIGILFAFASHHKEKEGYPAVAKLLNIFLSAAGCALLVYAMTQFVTNYKEVVNISSLKSFLFSPVFTLLSSPFIILTVFFIKYENMFLVLRRYRFLKPKRKLKIKLAIIKHANFNFTYIRNAHDILIWRKYELKDNKSISKYFKNAVKSKVDNSKFLSPY